MFYEHVPILIHLNLWMLTAHLGQVWGHCINLCDSSIPELL
jgi:hypothetical protein